MPLLCMAGSMCTILFGLFGFLGWNEWGSNWVVNVISVRVRLPFFEVASYFLMSWHDHISQGPGIESRKLLLELKNGLPLPRGASILKHVKVGPITILLC